MLWFMLVFGALHVLIPIPWLLAYFGLRREPHWVRLSLLAPLWAILAFVDFFLLNGETSFLVGAGGWVMLDVILRTAVPISLAVGAALLLSKMGVAARWQKGVACAVGMVGMLVQPAALLMLACGFAGECL